jgi:F-type H+-transporting ATPase subunit b
VATQTQTGVPGEHKAPFPPFQSETFASQLIWLVLAFVVLYVATARIVLPQVGSIFEARRNRIEGDLAEAQTLKDRSDAALAAYEKALADARSRAQALANETRERQAAEAEQHRKTLEASLNAKMGEAEQSISRTKDSAMANVRGIASDAAGAIVERLTGAAPSEKTLADALADVLKR